MKKILSVFTVFFMFMGMGISAVCGSGGYVIADVVSLTNFLSGKSDTVNDKNYDINDDGVWDVFDLCLLRRQFLNNKPENTPENKNDILVAYFSCTNNTKGIAEYVINYLNADSYAIEPKIPYTSDDLNYNSDCRANREQNDDTARPEISGGIDNMDDYSTVFIGYPIWWGQAPKIMYTFLESYDLSGKTIIPFCTSGSSSIGTSAKNLSASAPSSTWLDGKRFSGSAKENEVTSWVDSLDIKENEEMSENVFYVTANDTTFKAKFAGNSSADAFRELLEKEDMTINMHDYGNFEKVGSIGTALPQNNEQITTAPGDVILYQGNSITVYYDKNSWNFTRLGKIENVTKEELLDVFGKGDVEITFSIKGDNP